MNKVKCRLCGGRSSFIHKGIRHAPELEVYFCSSCNLAFLNPFPTEDELKKYYKEEDVYHKEDGDPGVEERFKLDLNEANIRAQRVLDEINENSDILEIGSGSGAFLYCLKSKVKDIVGIELNDESIIWMKKNNLRTVKNIKQFKRRKFDAIVMFHVLEHVTDPIGFLKNLKGYLKKEGKFIIEVPNHNDALNVLYEIPEFRNFNYCKPHLYYFSCKSLEKVFSEAGFNCKVSGIQRYDLSNHLRWMQTRKPGGHDYYKMFTEDLNEAYRKMLIKSGYSDTLWAVTK